MSSARPLVRLAFRPLSPRLQCRFASDFQRPASTRESATAGLVNDLLRNMVEGRPKPSSPGQLAPRTASDEYGSDRPRVPARFMSIAEARAKEREAEQLEEMRHPYTKKDLEKQATRRWQVGDVYAPRDLNGWEMAKWKKYRDAKPSRRDVLDQLGINPMREYKNFSMLAEYVSETGRIKPRKETGLRPVNQRRMARAIRRAAGIGLMPRTYKHPELLKREADYAKRRR